MTAVCTITGFIGYTAANGRPAHMKVEAGQEFAATDQIVVSRPDLFDVQPAIDDAPQEQPAAAPRPGATRPAGKKPKGGGNG
jgi:hypothetical protein